MKILLFVDMLRRSKTQNKRKMCNKLLVIKKLETFIY